MPGHGPVGGEREVRELQAYLRALRRVATGDEPAIPPGPWDSWLERDRDAINIERAALLAGGDDEMPPSMLKAIGFGLSAAARGRYVSRARRNAIVRARTRLRVRLVEHLGTVVVRERVLGRRGR